MLLCMHGATQQHDPQDHHHEVVTVVNNLSVLKDEQLEQSFKKICLPDNIPHSIARNAAHKSRLL